MLDSKDFFQPLSVAAQAIFADLKQAAMTRELTRSVSNISGSFHKKIKKGQIYWYYQTKNPDGYPQQVYLGPDAPEIQNLIAQRKNPVIIASTAQLSRLSAAAVELGAPNITPKHGRVIRKFGDYGFFKAGGVLAGTHAFHAYQNHFGVRWAVGQMTMDIDFAHPGNNITLAFPNQIHVDVRSAIDSLEMGFIPVYGQARFKKADEPDFDVDFLTTMTRQGSGPVEVKSLGISLQPLKFMELAFEQTLQTVVLLNDGPLVVTVPRPEYFAFHKIIVSVERKSQDPGKSLKDTLQSTALIEYFLENNHTPLLDAYTDVVGRGPGWKIRLEKGLATIDRISPGINVVQRLNDALSQHIRAEDDLLHDDCDPVERLNSYVP